MDLLREAAELERRLRADSETWGSKLDRMFSSLLSFEGDVEALDKEAQSNLGIGRGFAAIFLMQGVTGMPPIDGQDALQWVENWKQTKNVKGAWHEQVVKLTMALPKSYGSNLAAPLYSAAMKKSHNRREDADDLVSTVYTNFIGGAGQHLAPEPLPKAIAYVQRSINNLGTNIGEKTHNRERSLTRGPGEDEGLEREVADAKDIDKLMDEHNAKDIVQKIFHDPELKSELERIHPDALQYLQLNALGHEDKEILGTENPKPGEPAIIIGPSMLKHPYTKTNIRLYPSSWSTMKAKMFQVIKQHFKSGGEHAHEHYASYDYDRRYVQFAP